MTVQFDVEASDSDNVIDEQTSQMERVFRRFDCDGSGEISVDELGSLMEALGVKLSERDLTRILHEVDQDNSGFVTFDEFVKLLSLRVIQTVRDASFIDTRLTLATLLVGKHSALEEWIFATAVKQKTLRGKMLWLMWYTGLILGLISQSTFGSSWNAWRPWFNGCSVLMLPLPSLVFPVLTVDLIKELLLHGEMWCLLVLQISWLTMIIRILRDIRILFWICLMPSILVSAISDAYPAKFRARFQKLFFLGLLVSMVWWCLLVTLQWNEPISDPRWQFKGLQGSTVTASVLDVGTAMFFAVRNLWAAFRRPQEFVIIVSSTRTVQVQVTDAAANLSKRYDSIKPGTLDNRFSGSSSSISGRRVILRSLSEAVDDERDKDSLRQQICELNDQVILLQKQLSDLQLANAIDQVQTSQIEIDAVSSEKTLKIGRLSL